MLICFPLKGIPQIRKNFKSKLAPAKFFSSGFFMIVPFMEEYRFLCLGRPSLPLSFSDPQSSKHYVIPEGVHVALTCFTEVAFLSFVLVACRSWVGTVNVHVQLLKLLAFKKYFYFLPCFQLRSFPCFGRVTLSLSLSLFYPQVKQVELCENYTTRPTLISYSIFLEPTLKHIMI